MAEATDSPLVARLQWEKIENPYIEGHKMEIDNSHYRLILKLGKEMEINHHS
jgi:hypothetical protein